MCRVKGWGVGLLCKMLYWHCKTYSFPGRVQIMGDENKEKNCLPQTSISDITPVVGDECVKWHGQGSNSINAPYPFRH